MRRIWVIGLILLLLAGCAADETMETVADELAEPVLGQQKLIYVELPGEAASPAVESDSGRLYHCGDYEICVEILPGGDLDATVKTLSGFDREKLTLVQTQQDAGECYEMVWVSAGETGDRVGRAMILDDGSYHYCLMVLGDADKAEANQVFWDEMFASFRLS